MCTLVLSCIHLCYIVLVLKNAKIILTFWPYCRLQFADLYFRQACIDILPLTILPNRRVLFKISKFKLLSGLFRRLHIINIKCIPFTGARVCSVHLRCGLWWGQGSQKQVSRSSGAGGTGTSDWPELHAGNWPWSSVMNSEPCLQSDLLLTKQGHS